MKAKIFIALFSLLSVVLIILTPFFPLDEIISALIAGGIALFEASK